MIFTLILLVLELFEAYIQRADTLGGIIQNLYAYYQKSIFLFFLIHPGFYFVLFVVIYTNVLNISMIFIIALKIFDIFYKIELIKQLFIQRKISQQLSMILGWKIPSWYFFTGAMIYPPMLYLALN